jgi:hypothetical protein
MTKLKGSAERAPKIACTATISASRVESQQVAVAEDTYVYTRKLYQALCSFLGAL